MVKQELENIAAQEKEEEDNKVPSSPLPNNDSPSDPLFDASLEQFRLPADFDWTVPLGSVDGTPPVSQGN